MPLFISQWITLPLTSNMCVFIIATTFRYIPTLQSLSTSLTPLHSTSLPPLHTASLPYTPTPFSYRPGDPAQAARLFRPQLLVKHEKVERRPTVDSQHHAEDDRRRVG